MIPFLDLQLEYLSLEPDISRVLRDVLLRSEFVLGSHVGEFEKEFAAYCGARFGVGVGSGTDALYLALIAAGVVAGDEVITAANTAVPTLLAIVRAGARPVLVDANSRYTLDVAQLEKALTSRTRAIIPVHLYGNPSDMTSILSIAKSGSVQVIEDACQAHGAEYRGCKVGSIGNLGCFSFYPTKNLGCYGDGGMILTNDEDMCHKLRALRNLGRLDRDHYRYQGLNSRLDEIQAAILRLKLTHLEQWNNRRSELARMYDTTLRDVPVILPANTESARHVYHLYVIRTERRDQLKEFLKLRSIETLIHYPVPPHLQEACRSLGYRPGDFPNSEKYSREVLSLPLHPFLKDEEVEFIANAICKFFQ